MRNRIILISCLLLAAASARAGIEQFLDDRTVLAAEADLTKADPEAIGKWLTQTFKAANLLAAAGPGPNEVDLAAAMDRMKRWLADARAQGASVAYVVANNVKNAGIPFVTIVPVPDDKAQAVASLLYSGSTTGSTGPVDDRPASHRAPRAEAVAGVGAMMGTADRIAEVKAIQPKPRPELDSAWKSAGDAPVKLAVIPTPALQANMKGAPLPLLTLVGNTKWAVVSVTAPPQTSVRLTVQAKDADAAKQVQQMILSYSQMAVVSGAGLTPEFTKLLTPTVQGDQVTLTLDDKQLIALAGEMSGPIKLARQKAMHVASASNMRQLLVACMMYRNDNKQTWPDDLKSLDKYLGGGSVLTNPAHPEIKPAYVYFKPTEPIAEPGRQMILHESHTDFGDGVNVGFADGHVEFVTNPARFEELMAAAKPGPQL